MKLLALRRGTLSGIKKLTAVITVVCFVVTGVCGQAVAALTSVDPSATQFRKSSEDLFMIPPALGRITDGRFYGSRQIVLNIQNLHCHPEVQKNIDKILGAVEKKYAVSRLCLEGASGPLDTGWLSTLKDERLKKRLLNAMVDNGSLTGAEYHLLTAKPGYPACGLEDGQLYRENSLRLGRITAHREDTRTSLAVLSKELQKVKEDYFNARQKSLDKMIDRHRAGKLETRKYYLALAKYAASLHIDFSSYKHLGSFLKIEDNGRQMQYGRIAVQLQHFITDLRNRLPYSVYAALVADTKNFEDTGELYRRLASLVSDYNIDIAAAYPDLNRFLNNYSATTNLNPLSLVEEETCLEWELQRALSANKSEKEVVFLLDFFRLAKDYFDNKITAGDYAYFNENYVRFKLLCECYTGKDLVSPLDEQHELLTAFYQANLRRNEVFVHNVLEGGAVGVVQNTACRSKLDHIDAVLQALKNGSNATVVVAGGFHTTGIARLLDEKKVSYLTITPNITQNAADAEPVYWEKIREQNIFYSQAFQEALTIAAEKGDDGIGTLGELISAIASLAENEKVPEKKIREVKDNIKQIIEEGTEYKGVEVDVLGSGAKDLKSGNVLYFRVTHDGKKVIFRYTQNAGADKARFSVIPDQTEIAEVLNENVPALDGTIEDAAAIAVALKEKYPGVSVEVNSGASSSDGRFSLTVKFMDELFHLQYDPAATAKFTPTDPVAVLNVEQYGRFRSLIEGVLSIHTLKAVLPFAILAAGLALNTLFPHAAIAEPAGIDAVSAGFSLSFIHNPVILLTTVVAMVLNLSVRRGGAKLIEADKVYDVILQGLKEDVQKYGLDAFRGHIYFIVPQYWSIEKNNYDEMNKMKELLRYAHAKGLKLVLVAYYPLFHESDKSMSEEISGEFISQFGNVVPGAKVYMKEEFPGTRFAADFITNDMKPGDIIVINNGILHARKHLQTLMDNFNNAENKETAAMQLNASMATYQTMVQWMHGFEKDSAGNNDAYGTFLGRALGIRAEVPQLGLPNVNVQLQKAEKLLNKHYSGMTASGMAVNRRMSVRMPDQTSIPVPAKKSKKDSRRQRAVDEAEKTQGVKYDTKTLPNSPLSEKQDTLADLARKGKLKVAVTFARVADNAGNPGAWLLRRMAGRMVQSPSAPYRMDEIKADNLKKALAGKGNPKTVEFVLGATRGYRRDTINRINPEQLLKAVNEVAGKPWFYKKVMADMKTEEFDKLIKEAPEDVEGAFARMMKSMGANKQSEKGDVYKVNRYLLGSRFTDSFKTEQNENQGELFAGRIEGQSAVDKGRALSWIARSSSEREKKIHQAGSVGEAAGKADLVLLSDSQETVIDTLLAMLDSGLENKILLMKGISRPYEYKDYDREIRSYYEKHQKGGRAASGAAGELIAYLKLQNVQTMEEAVRAVIAKREAKVRVVVASNSLYKHLMAENGKAFSEEIELKSADEEAIDVVAEMLKRTISQDLKIKKEMWKFKPVTAPEPAALVEEPVNTADTGMARPERNDSTAGDAGKSSIQEKTAGEEKATEHRKNKEFKSWFEKYRATGVLPAVKLAETMGELINTKTERELTEAILQPNAKRLEKYGMAGKTYFAVYYAGKFDEQKYADVHETGMNSIIIMPGKVSPAEQLSPSIPVKFKDDEYLVHIGVHKLFPTKVHTALVLHVDIDGFNGSEKDRRELFGKSVGALIEKIAEKDSVLQRKLLVKGYGLPQNKINPGILHLNGLPTATVVTEGSEALKGVPVLFTPSDDREPEITPAEQAQLEAAIENNADVIVSATAAAPDVNKAAEMTGVQKKWASLPVIVKIGQGFTKEELEQLWELAGEASRNRKKDAAVADLRPQVMIDVKAKEQNSTEVLTLTDIGNRVKQYYGTLGTDLLLDVLDPSNPRTFSLEMLDESKVPDNLKNNKQQVFLHQLKELFQIARQPAGEGSRDIRVFARYNVPKDRGVDIEEIKYLVQEVGFSGIWLDLSRNTVFPDAETLGSIKRAVPDAVIMVVPPAGSEDAQKKFRTLLQKEGILPFAQLTIDSDPKAIEDTDIGIQVVAGSSRELYLWQFLKELDKFVTSDKAAVVIPSDYWSLFRNIQDGDASVRQRLQDEGQFLDSFAQMIVNRIKTNPAVKYQQAHEQGLTAPLSPNKLDEFYKKLHLMQEHKEGEAYNLYDLLKIYNEADRSRLEEYAKSGKLFDRGIKLLKDSYPGTLPQKVTDHTGDLKKMRNISTRTVEEKMMYDRMLMKFIDGLLEQVEAKTSPDDATLNLTGANDGANFEEVKALLGGFFTFEESKGRKKEKTALKVTMTTKNTYEALRSLPGAFLAGKKYDEALSLLQSLSTKINNQDPIETKLVYLEALYLYANAVGDSIDKRTFKSLANTGAQFLFKPVKDVTFEQQGFYHNAAQIVLEFDKKGLVDRNQVDRARAIIQNSAAAIADGKRGYLDNLKALGKNGQLRQSEGFPQKAKELSLLLAMINLSHNDKLFDAREKAQIKDFIDRNLLTDYGLYSGKDQVSPAGLMDYALLEASIMKEKGKTVPEISHRMLEIVRPLLTKAAENGGLPEYLNADGTLPDGQTGRVAGALAAMVQLIAAYAERRDESLLTEEQIEGAVKAGTVRVESILGIQEAA